MAGIFGLLMSGAGVLKDQYFNLTSLLLPGNGTNGAQNNTFLDSSTNNFTITRNGNTTQGTFSPFSQTGWSNRFDGSSNYRLTIPDSTDLDLTGDFCLEMWVYVTANSSSGQLVCIGNENAGQNGFIFYLPGGTTTVSLYTNGGTPLTTSSGAIALNTWHHLALVRSGAGAGNTVIYVDGVSKGSAQITTSFTGIAANGLCIGQTYNGSFVGVSNTYISNVRLVKGSPVYTGAFTPPTSPLTAITNTVLLTCQSNRFVDTNTQTTAKTITVTGSPSVQAFSPFNPLLPWTAATYGGSGYFDGSGDYLSIANNAAFNFGSGAFTIELWYYPTTLSGTQCLITNYGGSTTGFVVQMGGSTAGSGKIDAGFSGDGADITSTNTVQLNSWNHIAISGTPGATGIKLFINGNQEGSTYTGATSLDTSATLLIGEVASTNRLSGYLSGLRLLKGTALYTTAFTPPTAPLTNITNTSLLLNFTNAGVIDATAKNVLETVGNAQISTGAAKFGTTSIYFDGTSDYLLLPNSSLLAFGGGDFTCEFWMYHTATGGTYAFIFGSTSASNTTGWFAVRFEGAYGLLGFAANNAAVLTASSTLSANTWHHVALVRNGTSTNNLKWYLNGTASGQTTYTTNIGSGSTSSYAVGADVPLSRWYGGYIQGLRITNGYARYTANFTPPTAPFPVQ
jgi:hypothetical protein